MTYLCGRLSRAERQNSWQLAGVTGAATPAGFQYLLGAGDWAADAVRDGRRFSIRQPLGEAHAVLGIDETGVLKKSQRSAGVARQDRGPAGKVENCQLSVLVADASPLGHALFARARSLPAK